MVAVEQYGRYRVEKVIGRGGFAVVYRAEDTVLTRAVALKALREDLAHDERVRARFLDEARALARLRHPNVVTVFDVGVSDERPFFTMELLVGVPLDALLARGPRLSLERTVALLRPLAAALDALHAEGLVHRDVKPSNISIEPGDRVVLMDLGIAHSAQSAVHTDDGVALGTPAYMSPEQVRGAPVGPAADIYALAVIAYQMLAGYPPFGGEPAAVLHAQAYDQPPSLAAVRPDLPSRVSEAIAAALAKRPSDRPRPASAFVAQLAGDDVAHLRGRLSPRLGPEQPTLELRALPDEPPSGAQPPPRSRSTGVPFLRWRPSLLIAVALLATVLLVVFSVRALQNQPRGSPSVAEGTARPRETTSVPSAFGGIPSPTPAGNGAAPADIGSADAIRGFTVRDIDTWSAGQGALQGCATYQNVPAGTALRVRIAPATDPAQPLAQSELATLPAGTGQVCLPVPAPATIPPGDYMALLYDANWQQHASFAFNVLAEQPSPTAAAATAPATATAAATETVAVASATASATATEGTAAPPALSAPPAPSASAPGPRLVAVIPSGPASAGGLFTFSVTAENDGASGSLSSITVSSPDVSGLTAQVGACDMPATASALPPGSGIAVLSSGRMQPGRSSAWLAEVDARAWPAGARCTLTVSAQLPPSGSVAFLLRATSEDGAGRVYSYPATAEDADQQGFPAVRWQVAVGR